MAEVLSEHIRGKLTHWVKERYKEKVLKGEFAVHQKPNGNKPPGLWLSWKGGWEYFCKHDYEGGIKGCICLEAKLKSGLKLWLIDSMEDFLEIWKKFTDRKPDYISLHNLRSRPITKAEINPSGEQLPFWDWLKALGFDGVVLSDTGYYETKFETWLYGWDCSSVVIFEPTNVTLLDQPKRMTWRQFFLFRKWFKPKR